MLKACKTPKSELSWRHSIDAGKTCVKALIYPYYMVLIFLHHLIQL